MKARKFKPLTELRVWWNDIVQCAGWTEQEKVLEVSPAKVYTIGIYRGVKDNNLILCSTYTLEEQTSDYLVIPYGCIEKIEVIDNGG